STSTASHDKPARPQTDNPRQAGQTSNVPEPCRHPQSIDAITATIGHESIPESGDDRDIASAPHRTGIGTFQGLLRDIQAVAATRS
ncbi:hypothetical protein, partial [Pseudofrankia sp. BMG5.36]|uniref:hypothetical protein n=1 Tax=Pseudofrankia sp. BMG5.36 TaxID=1834512 RepID=UPI001A7E12DD